MHIKHNTEDLEWNIKFQLVFSFISLIILFIVIILRNCMNICNLSNYIIKVIVPF